MSSGFTSCSTSDITLARFYWPNCFRVKWQLDMCKNEHYMLCIVFQSLVWVFALTCYFHNSLFSFCYLNCTVYWFSFILMHFAWGTQFLESIPLIGLIFAMISLTNSSFLFTFLYFRSPIVWMEVFLLLNIFLTFSHFLNSISIYLLFFTLVFNLTFKCTDSFFDF